MSGPRFSLFGSRNRGQNPKAIYGETRENIGLGCFGLAKPTFSSEVAVLNVLDPHDKDEWGSRF